MNTKPIDKSKKSNIKCEHCKYFRRVPLKITTVENQITGSLLYLSTTDMCGRLNIPKHYWNRCKYFEWTEGRNYIEFSK